MDILRGQFGSPDYGDDARDDDFAEDDAARELPPTAIGTDERRMQVRAYNHWASLLDDRNFPSIEDLEPERLTDFGPYSVLLDFTAGIENPAIQYLGAALAEECGTGAGIEHLSDVPSRSLLSRITDHYMQILANQAPIGFEAEFVNQRSATILYRGILLPYSSDGETIDFIYGVINWKEMADQITTDELLLEIDQVLDPDPLEAAPPAARIDEPVADWADGPGTAHDLVPLDSPVADLPLDEPGLAAVSAFPEPAFGGPCADDEPGAATDDYAAAYGADDADDASDAIVSRLSSLIHPRTGAGANPGDDDWDEIRDGSEEGFEPLGASPLLQKKVKRQALDLSPATETADLEDGWSEPADDAGYADLGSLLGAEAPVPAEPVAVAPAQLAPTAGPASDLHDCLADARELAEEARHADDRSRASLYAAIGRAYDVSLAAEAAPQEFAELLEESGLEQQDRAPLTPVVKLVFGPAYDKTRLAEFASALAHASRLGVARGQFGAYLARAEGGLKGVVAAERRLRKEESGQPVEPHGSVRSALARKLRKLDGFAPAAIPADGAEFALVMIRRDAAGTVTVLGEIADDIALVERAARKLLG